MLALLFDLFCSSIQTMAVISENIVVASITAFVAIISGPIVTVLMFILKDRSDRQQRRESLEEARIAREEIKGKIVEVKEAAHVAYKEANNVNLKLKSLGIQTSAEPES